MLDQAGGRGREAGRWLPERRNVPEFDVARIRREAKGHDVGPVDEERRGKAEVAVEIDFIDAFGVGEGAGDTGLKAAQRGRGIEGSGGTQLGIDELETIVAERVVQRMIAWLDQPAGIPRLLQDGQREGQVTDLFAAVDPDEAIEGEVERRRRPIWE